MDVIEEACYVGENVGADGFGQEAVIGRDENGGGGEGERKWPVNRGCC